MPKFYVQSGDLNAIIVAKSACFAAMAVFEKSLEIQRICKLFLAGEEIPDDFCYGCVTAVSELGFDFDNHPVDVDKFFPSSIFIREMGVDLPFMRPKLLEQSIKEDTLGVVRKMWMFDRIHKKLHEHRKGECK